MYMMHCVYLVPKLRDNIITHLHTQTSSIISRAVFTIGYSALLPPTTPLLAWVPRLSSRSSTPTSCSFVPSPPESGALTAASTPAATNPPTSTSTMSLGYHQRDLFHTFHDRVGAFYLLHLFFMQVIAIFVMTSPYSFALARFIKDGFHIDRIDSSLLY